MSELASADVPSSDQNDGSETVQVRLFGPMEIFLGGRELQVRAPQERALLALLLTAPGRVVAVSDIVAGLWGEQAPRSAVRTVQSYVSRLRRALGDAGAGLLVTRAPGYLAAVAPQRVDAVRFANLADAARRALTADKAAQAAELAREALELGRGEVLAEFDAPFAARERTRLTELRLLTVETRYGAELALGAGAELVGELEGLVRAHPLRERLWEQLIVALYRAGRQADALAAYRRVRSVLVEELGIEPGQDVRDLERKVLAQDPALLGRAGAAGLPAALSTANRLFGREAELGWLTDAYRLSRSGGVICRLVKGPAGIGKTRLVAELAAAAHDDGAVVDYARGGDVMTLRPPPTGRPAIVVADDLHLARADQVDQMARLVRAAAGPLLVVLVAQPAQLSADTAAALTRIGAGELVLGELSPPAVSDLIRDHLGAQADVAAAVSALAPIGGVPGRVHRAVHEWVQRQETAQVNDAASRVPAARDQLSADQDDLRDLVLSLQRLRQAGSHDDGPDTQPPVCPYKGLAAFDTDDAEFFFGRERLIAQLITRLVGARLLAVVGNSGVGKSSTVKAGLLPALRAGTLPGSADWIVTVTTPTQGLPTATQQERHHLVVVDQFEEVFTTLGDAARTAYLDQLIALARPGSRANCVLTLRADYYPHCATRSDLAALLADNTVLVAPMSVDELRAAIEGPAARAGLSLDEGLTDTLLNDTADQAGALPLLSTALLNLWQHRDGNRLTLRGYLATGGVRQAINDLAESAYTRLDPTQRTIARRILLRLADSGEGGEYIRRRAPLREVAPDDNARHVIDVLSSRRLITTTEDAVEIAHEAVLREWPRLRAWLDDDEVGRRLRSHMTIAAYEWDTRGRDPADLYRGPRLTAALEWMDQHPDDVTTTERDYLEAGRVAAEIETLRRRRSIRRLRAFAGALAIMLVVALAASGMALLQGQRADRQAVAADARALRARAATDSRWDRALLYAAQAEHLEPTPDSRATLLSTLQRSPQAIGVMHADARVQKLALSADGSRLAAGTNTGQVMVWDTTSHERIATVNAIPSPYWAPSVDLSDDGRLLAAAGYNTADPGNTGDTAFISVTDLQDKALVPRMLPLQHVVGAAFLRGTDTLIIRQQNGALRIVDAVTGATVPGPVFDTSIISGDCSLPYLNLSANARFVATGCSGSPAQPAGVWDVQTGRKIWPGRTDAPLLADDQTTVLAVNSAGTIVIRGRLDGKVDAIELTTRHVRTSVDAQTVGVGTLTWSADGKAFVTTAERTSVIWNPTTLQPIMTLRGHTSGVRDAAFAPDGRTLYTGGFDDSVFVWDIGGHRRVAQPVGQTTGFRANYQEHAFDDAGTLVVTSLVNGTIDVTDLTPQDGPGSYVIGGREAQNISDIDMDRKGSALAYTQYDDTHGLVARVLDIRTHHLRPFAIQVDSPRPGDASGGGIGISGDGRWLTTVDFEGRTREWDAVNGAVRPGIFYLAEKGAGGPVVSSDGQLVALTSAVDVLLVNLASRPPRLVAKIPALLDVAAPAFSADSRLLAVGTGVGEVIVIDTASAAVLHRWPGTDGPGLNAVRFGPDSNYLISGDVNGKAIMWNIDTAPGGAAVIDFGSAGGNTIAGAFRGTSGILTIDNAGSVLLWDTDATSLATRSCDIVRRNLTQAEWSAVLPDRPYEVTCPTYE